MSFAYFGDEHSILRVVRISGTGQLRLEFAAIPKEDNDLIQRDAKKVEERWIGIGEMPFQIKGVPKSTIPVTIASSSGND